MGYLGKRRWGMYKLRIKREGNWLKLGVVGGVCLLVGVERVMGVVRR